MRVLLTTLLLGCTGLTTPSPDQAAEAGQAASGAKEEAPAARPVVSTDPAAAPAKHHDGPLLDIYLSAGNHQVDAAGEVTASCNNEDSLNCAIYKVTWNFDEQRATAVQLLVDDPGYGTFYPAISPNGQYLSYTASPIRNGKIRAAMNHTVFVRDLGAFRGGEHPVVNQIPVAKWAGWLDDETLLVTRFTEPHWGDMMSVGRESGAPKRLLGPGDTKRGPSFSQARANPVDNHLVSSHGDDVYKGPKGATVPHVNDLRNGKQYGFVLDRTGDGTQNLVGCAHAAWTPDGNGVVCTEQATDDFPYEGGPDYNHMHRFVKQGDQYVPVQADPVHKGYLFKPKSPEELRAFHPDFYTVDHRDPVGGGYCQGTIYYKNAVMCSEHTAVLTLWCTDNVNYDKRKKVVNSRSVLVDFEDWDNPKHYDLTGALEEAGVLSGAHSDFVTCY
jgi:hypothetical protein